MNENFVFYASWLEIIMSNYADDVEMQKEIAFNILQYGILGERNETVEKMFMQQVFAQIDSAKAKHEKRVKAGRSGGLAGKGVSRNQGNKNNSKNGEISKAKAGKNPENVSNSNGSKNNSIAFNSKSIANDNDKVNDNGNDNDNASIINLTVNNTEPASVGTRLEAVPPPQGFEWTARISDLDGVHYRRCRRIGGYETRVIRLD